MIKFVTMTPRIMNRSATILFALVFISALLNEPVSAQRPSVAARFYEMAQEIDSLQNTVAGLNQKLYKKDSLYKAEKYTTAELRDRILKMEQEQKSLEASKTDVEGENLKLNQSNRILIIFNSVVAVLLVITLIFVIKRAGKKLPLPATATPARPKVSESLPVNKLATFEDKLAQLEKLGELKEKGILSDEEFQNEKQRILGR